MAALLGPALHGAAQPVTPASRAFSQRLRRRLASAGALALALLPAAHAQKAYGAGLVWVYDPNVLATNSGTCVGFGNTVTRAATPPRRATSRSGAPLGAARHAPRIRANAAPIESGGSCCASMGCPPRTRPD